MKHAVPAYLEWWRAYLTLSCGCSQLMLKSMQQVLDASVAAWVYRPASASARLSPVLPMPTMVAPAWGWSAALLPQLPHNWAKPMIAAGIRTQSAAVDRPELDQVMAQVIRLVANPRK